MICTHEQFPDVDWCGLAINRGDGFSSRLIAQASVSKWWLLLPFPRILDSVASHVRVIFGRGDKTLFYFEAQEFDSEGWSGPHSEGKAIEWASEHPRRWTRRYRYVPSDPDSTRLMWKACVSRKGVWHYDTLQNVGVWVHRWTGKRLPLQDRGVNCGEGGARLMWELYGELLCPDKPFDLVTPYDVQRVLVGPTWQVIP